MNKETVKTKSGKIYEFTRIKNDVNGNPRYLVSWLALGLSGYNDGLSQFGLYKYRGKDFGGGYVFQSYNLRVDAERFEELFNKKD